ncbi:HAD-like protein [Phellopilus nigrolimitatus]|nr:HAD-like protein [Phellopilus nigrolimitatus]
MPGRGINLSTGTGSGSGAHTRARIRLASFDALFTLLRPRQPIHVQYAHAFAPFFGPLAPDAVKAAFKKALRELQAARPAYAQGPEGWWRAVIMRTAVGAGADTQDVQRALPVVVPQLLKRFSSREGYALYDDALPTLKSLRETGVATALVSNADSRILAALDDLGALAYLDHILVSDAEGVEKPHPEIFLRACARAKASPGEAAHVGDELECDYFGASRAGLHALLLSRPPENQAQRTAPEETSADGVRRITGLDALTRFVRDHNI